MLSVLMEISSLFGALLGVFFLSNSQLYYRSFASFCLDYWKTVAERYKKCLHKFVCKKMTTTIVVNVSFRNKIYALRLPESATVRDLSVSVREALPTLDLHTMKFIGLSKVPVKPSSSSSSSSSPPLLLNEFESIRKGKKILLVASEMRVLEKMKGDEKVNVRMRGFEDELKREKRRDVRYASRQNKGEGVAYNTSSREFTFHSLRVLPIPDGIVEPSKEKTMSILEKLKRDPGVRRVMETHRFSVGLLCEMPPEGLVGVSETCILGFNRNQGMEIHLRLRTDDWRGLRRYESIRRVLMHELAHNVISEHNVEFKALNSELVKLCERDWNRGRRVGSGEVYGNDNNDDAYDSLSEDECMKETRKLSGMKLGGGDGGANTRGNNPREMAARKALQRFEQQQKQQEQEEQQQHQNEKITWKMPQCSCGACGDGEITCQPC